MSPQNDEQLRRFVLARQEVASVVRAIRQSLEESGQEESKKQAQDLLVKLAEDRFNLAVVGQFKRGKSSLMNAVIGRALLPTGLLPLTSAITTLCYGPREQVFLVRKGWNLEQEIPLEELADYVTEKGNPGNERGLIEARIELPVPFLRRGLHFIDTPGVGSARQENTATTYDFLPNADAVIFVTSVEAPLGQVEADFLHDIHQYARRLFVIVNKIDLLGMPEYAQVLDYVQSRIERILDTDSVRLYPVSAQLGLDAKVRGDPDALQQSGLAAFEEDLVRFLADEKSLIFLVSILDRGLQLLGEGSQLRERIKDLRLALLSGQEFGAGEAAVDLSTKPDRQSPMPAEMNPRPAPDPGIAEIGKPSTRSCPICAAATKAAFDLLVSWQSKLMSQDPARQMFAAGHGFCHFHTWQFEQIASPRAISEGFSPLVDRVMVELTELAEVDGRSPAHAASRLESLLPTPQTCPVCRTLSEMEIKWIEEFVNNITAPYYWSLYKRSPGLCLPHLRRVLAASPARQTRQLLLEEAVRRLQEVSEDMHSFVLKREALRRGLLNAEESSAWRRALVLLIGEQAVRIKC